MRTVGEKFGLVVVFSGDKGTVSEIMSSGVERMVRDVCVLAVIDVWDWGVVL